VTGGPGAAGEGHEPDLGALRFRAESLRKLREFFRERGVLEIETPILSRGISLDCHIDVFAAEFHPGGYARAGTPGEAFYLQTSPEPHMKRLLCRGFPDLYQVTRAFRNGERGRVHNPEFTMLEWYRKDFTLEALVDEVVALCLLLAPGRAVERKTWSAAFRDALGFDPIDLALEELLAHPASREILPRDLAFATRADALDFLMAHAVEPAFAPDRLTVVTGFPADQAAQAGLDPADPRRARRFEVYGHGMELGNGYQELLDPGEYARRFDRENARRRGAGKPELPPDPALLDDLRRGLPPCAGVAMGLDRLLLFALGRSRIGDVLAFPWATC
jgi:lysyl-tRNA synthetase class 2